MNSLMITESTAAAGGAHEPYDLMKYPKYDSFMNQYKIKKTDPQNPTTPQEITNTRMPRDTPPIIYAAKYSIPENKYFNDFLRIYYRDIILLGRDEYLTEIQLKTGRGPILIDLDFRLNEDITERQFTKEHIDILMMHYLNILKEIHNFDPDETIRSFVFTKDAPVNFTKGDFKCVKDGIHILIGLQCDHSTQEYIRQQIVEKITNGNTVWNLIPFLNDFDNVFDKCVSTGKSGWPLYGSKKPNNKPYKIAYIYDWTLDENFSVIQNEIPLDGFNLIENIHKLSARYENNPPFYATDFYQVFLEKFEEEKKLKEKLAEKQLLEQHQQHLLTTNSINSTVNRLDYRDSLQISTVEQLDTYINEVFLQHPTIKDTEFSEAFDYVMILPEEYYCKGSYVKRICVGWALKRMGIQMFTVWLRFNCKSTSFSMTDRFSLMDEWDKFAGFEKKGYGLRSIRYWARKDAYEEFIKINKIYSKKLVEDIIANKNAADYDFAKMLFVLNKDKYVCASIKNVCWFEFLNHRWDKSESGTGLRHFISNEMRGLFRSKQIQIVTVLIPNSKDDNEKESLKQQREDIGKIIMRLADTRKIDNIMKEALHIFYDKNFLKNLDENMNLLCFNNGVLDLVEKQFRDGLPQDYISKSTNIDYIPLNEIEPEYIDEINEFMRKLFPIPELCNYMWQHLASTLTGQTPNQTFNFYLGEKGANGKSTITDLMQNVLGDYASDANISLILEKRKNTGQASPEIVALKGARYIIMNEPEKGAILNDGYIKHLTSGVEKLEGRGLFKEDMTKFIPQLKLVICANNLITINTTDGGMWRRVRVVPFLASFSENPDPNIKYQTKIVEKVVLLGQLKKWKNAFMALLVETFFKTDGIVTDCDIVLQESRKYRTNEDIIAQFIEEMIQEVEHGELTLTDLKEEFNNWKKGRDDGKKGFTLKDVEKSIINRFGEQQEITVGLTNKTKKRVWKGISLNIDYDATDNNSSSISSIIDPLTISTSINISTATASGK